VTTASGLQETWMRTHQFQGSETGQLRTLVGLDSWQVYFFQGAWANCQSSLNAANPSTVPALVAAPGASAASGLPGTSVVGVSPSGIGGGATQLPTGIRVVLAFAPGSGLVGNLTRDILITP
jgi:general secretion pathway protein J